MNKGLLVTLMVMAGSSALADQNLTPFKKLCDVSVSMVIDQSEDLMFGRELNRTVVQALQGAGVKPTDDPDSCEDQDLHWWIFADATLDENLNVYSYAIYGSAVVNNYQGLTDLSVWRTPVQFSVVKTLDDVKATLKASVSELTTDFLTEWN